MTFPSFGVLLYISCFQTNPIYIYILYYIYYIYIYYIISIIYIYYCLMSGACHKLSCHKPRQGTVGQKDPEAFLSTICPLCVKCGLSCLKPGKKQKNLLCLARAFMQFHAHVAVKIDNNIIIYSLVWFSGMEHHLLRFPWLLNAVGAANEWQIHALFWGAFAMLVPKFVCCDSTKIQIWVRRILRLRPGCNTSIGTRMLKIQININ